MVKSKKNEKKEEFAKRLRAAIESKGWTAGKAAREARRYLGPGEHLSHAHMWHYLHARSIPRSRYLSALSRALEINPEDLVRDVTRVSKEANSDPATTLLNAELSFGGTSRNRAQVQVRNGKDGTAVLQISDEVPWAMALQILQLLKDNPRLSPAAMDEVTPNNDSELRSSEPDEEPG
jgi:hypothetical protein